MELSRMRSLSRVGLSLVAGTLAAGTSFAAASGVADPTQTWIAAGLNGVVWTAAIALYLPVYERFDGAPASGDQTSAATAMKWGGLAGGAASLGISGTGVLLVGGYSNWYVGAVCLFVFGLFFLSMTVGMGTVAANLPGSRGGDGLDADSETDTDPADD